MNNNVFQSARVGLFFVLGLALIYVVYEAIGSKALDTNKGYTVTAVFDDIKTLTAGDDVRMAGVRIGTVAATGLSEGRASAVLNIQPEFTIPEDSIARIAIASLLGKNYVAIEYGAASTALANGQPILTETSSDLNDIMRQVGELGEKLNKIADGFAGTSDAEGGGPLANFNALITDNRERLDRILANLDELTTALNEGEGTLGRLIRDDSIYSELEATVAEFKGAATEARQIFTDARSFFSDVREADGLLNRLIFDESLGKDIELTLTNFRDFSEKLNSEDGTIGKLLGDDTLYLRLQGMLDKADKALDGLSDAGPMSAVGAVGTALF